MKLVIAFLVLAAVAAGALGCTTTQRVMSGAAMGGVGGFALAGPVGAAVGGVAGGAAGAAVPLITAD